MCVCVSCVMCYESLVVFCMFEVMLTIWRDLSVNCNIPSSA